MLALPHKTAIEYRDNTISYAELGRTTEALAAGLMQLGVRPGTSVRLYLPNTPYHPYFFFAVLKAGGRIVQSVAARCRAGAGL